MRPSFRSHAAILATLAAGLPLLAHTAAAKAPSDVPVYGAPNQAAEYQVYVAMHAFSDAELAPVNAVVFADAGLHGALRVPGDYHVLNTPLGPTWHICGEAWGTQGWVVLVDDPFNCGPLDQYRIRHELCHLVVGVQHEHDAVWTACMQRHGT